MARREFTASHVRLWEGEAAEETRYLAAERFWVVGIGISAPFVTRCAAQAYVFDTAAHLGLAENGLQIVVRNLTPVAPFEIRPIVNFDPIAPRPLRLAFGPVSLPRPDGTPPLAAMSGPTLWDRLSDDDA
jgi:hypothetical protein